MTAAGGAAWRDAHQETGERIGLGQGADARRRVLVAERREIELQVRPRLVGAAPKETAGLVDAEREWSATERGIAQCGRDLPPPRIEFVIESGLARPVCMIVAEMVLQVLP